MMIVARVNSTMIAVGVNAMKDTLGLPVIWISMNVVLSHLSVREVAYATTLMEASLVRVQHLALKSAMLVVAVLVLGEVPVVVIAQLILLVSVHLGMAVNAVKTS